MAKHIQSKAGSYLKRVFFYYPFYVDIEGKSQMMNLTVYEDSDAKELGQKVAEKFGLPDSSAERLRVAIEDEFLQRVKLKVNVDLAETGEKKLLLVLKNENAEQASRRFAVQNGISTAGQLVRHFIALIPAALHPVLLCLAAERESIHVFHRTSRSTSENSFWPLAYATRASRRSWPRRMRRKKRQRRRKGGSNRLLFEIKCVVQ